MKLPGKAVLMGPASGKSTLVAKSGSKNNDVTEVEQYIDFRICLYDSLYQKQHPSIEELSQEKFADFYAKIWTNTSTIYHPDLTTDELAYTMNWEGLSDFNALWFRAYFPVLMALLRTRRTVFFNGICPENILSTGFCIDGLNALQPGVVTASCISSKKLDAHLKSRRDNQDERRVDHGPLSYQHHNYTWTRSNHALIHGLVTKCKSLHDMKDEDLRSHLATKNTSGPDFPSDEMIQFAVEETKYTLVEVLPLCWALFDVTDTLNPIFHGLYRNLKGDGATTVLYLDPYSGKQATYASIRLGPGQFKLYFGFKDPSVSEPHVAELGNREKVAFQLDCKSFETDGTTEFSSKRCVLLYFGTFAPFHLGHLEAVELAKCHLEHQGWEVLGAHLTPSPTVSTRESPLCGLDSWTARATIAYFCTAHLDWIKVDFAGGFPENCVESLSARVAKDVTVFWVNGTDVGMTSRVEEKLELCERKNVKMLFVPRDGQTFQAEGCRPGDEIEICQFPPKLNQSATEVRKLIVDRQNELAAEKIGNKAAAAYCVWSHQVGDYKTDHELAADAINNYYGSTQRAQYHY